MYKIHSFFFAIAFLHTIQSGFIIPDSQNPFQVFRSNVVSSGYSHTLYFNFELPNDSPGLGYRQIIAVQFPLDSTIKTALALDNSPGLDGISNKFQCALFDISSPSSPIQINVQAIASHSSEASTFLCRIEDLVSYLVAGKRYGLRISLLNPSGFSSTFNVVRQISLFTSSSTINPVERIILDSNPIFANMALYADFLIPVTGIFGISPSTPVITTSVSSPIKLEFDVIVNSIFKGSEVNVYLEWDSSVIVAATTLSATTSEIVGTAAHEFWKKEYPNTLRINLVPGFNNLAQISGIKDDLTVGRTWKIIISGFSAGSLATSSTSQISLYVYYKNSYSLLSISRYQLINLMGMSFSVFSARAYDRWEYIRQGGAWNVQFSFLPSISYDSEGYVVLRQNNAEINKSKINFLASTCDFSPMIPSIIESNVMGKRPICYPLRMNYNYKNSEGNNAMTGPHLGSGIFFRLPRLSQLEHSWNVFIFAEWCNNSSDTNTNFNLSLGPNTFTGTYSFTLSFYKNIDISKANEFRFSSSNLVVSSTILPINSLKCYSNFWAGLEKTSKNAIERGNYSSTNFIYREINDFILPVINSPYSSTCNCWFNAINSAPPGAGLEIGSLFNTSSSTTNLLTGTRYLALVGMIGTNNITVNGYRSICNYIACAKRYDGSAWVSPSFWRMEFSIATRQGFFVTGDSDNCFYSWGFTVWASHALNNSANTNSWASSTTPPAENNSQVNLLSTSNASSYPTSSQRNMIAKFNTSGNYDMKSPSTILITTNSPVSFISAEFTNNNFVDFPKFTTEAGTTITLNQSFTFALLNSCVKWTNANGNPYSLVSSTYNYIDIQLNVQEATTAISLGGTYYTTKVNRFFKFVTDSYVLDHSRKIDASADSVIIWHFVNFNNAFSHQSNYPSWAHNSVCMIQIITVAGIPLPAGTNTLVVYLSNLMLLEMDPTDVSATYPINSTKAMAYGLTSLPFFIGTYLLDGSTQKWSSYPWYHQDYAFSGAMAGVNDFQTLIGQTSSQGIPPKYTTSATPQEVSNFFQLNPDSIVTRSIPKLYLGSSLWIYVGTEPWIGNTGAFTNTDIILPIYCPVVSSSTATVVQSYTPIVQLNFFGNRTGSYVPTSFESMYVPRKTNPGQGCTNGVAVITAGFVDQCQGSWWAPSVHASKLNDSTNVSTKNNHVLTLLRWSSYSSSSAKNVLSLCPKCYLTGMLPQANPTSSSNDHSCTAFTTFLSPAIFFDKAFNVPSLMNPTTLFTNNGINMNSVVWTPLPTKRFIFNGKVFNKIHIPTIDTKNVFTLGSYSATYNGFLRPELNTVITSNGLISQSNQVGFFCVNKDDKNYFFTNYFENNTQEGNFGNFLVDWSYNSAVVPAVAEVSKDSGTQYKDDSAGNLKVTFKMPLDIYLPPSKATQITLNMSVITANSVCGVSYGNSRSPNRAEPCSNDSNNNFVCEIGGSTAETGNIIICCYGVNVNLDTIPFPNQTSGANFLYVNFPSNMNFPQNLGIGGNIYNMSGLSSPTVLNNWVTENAKNFHIPSSTTEVFKPSIVMTSLVPQEGVYSKVTFTVNLAREAVRNSSIVISGDLSFFQIINFNPKCGATFQSADHLIDRFIESCSVNLSMSGFIIVKIANRVVKCGLSLPKVLYVSLWPVQVVKDTLPIYNLQMVFPSTGSLNLLQNPLTFALTHSPSLPLAPASLPIVNRNIQNLCNLLSITPPIVGEYGDFLFSFDFSLIPKATSNDVQPNEVFLFFPHNNNFNVFADGFSSPISCYFGTSRTLVSCNSVEENWLRITIPVFASLNADQQILVSGIRIPSFSAGNLNFVCSLNRVDLNNSRNVWLTGSGTFSLPNGISDPSSKNGLLRLLSVNAEKTEPRVQSSITLNVSFDTALLAAQTIPTQIDSDPFFIVTLPFPDFNMNFYPRPNVVSVFITETIFASGTNSAVVNRIFNKQISTFSNKIFIPLADQVLNISPTFQFWSIQITGLQMPIDSTLISTGSFSVTLSNSKVSSLYRTYTNLSSNYGKELNPNYDNMPGFNTNNLIGFSRGITYNFSSSKYVIDVSECIISRPLGNQIKNYIYLKPGRANNCQFVVRPFDANNKLPQNPVNITNSDSFVTLNSQNISLNPTLGRASFWIGVPCQTIPGTYYLNFRISDTENYYPIPPIILHIDSNASASRVVPPASIPETAQGGFQPINFSLSDYPAEKIIYKFNPSNRTITPTQDPSAAVVTNLTNMNSEFEIRPFTNNFNAFFVITNSSARGNQTFVTNSTNTCFNNPISLTFGISSDQKQMSTVPIQDSFKDFKNGDTEGANLEKNVIQFTFTPPVAPIFLNCMLICSSMQFVDSHILTGTGFVESPLVRFYSQYLATSGGSTIVKFQNLVRGMNYQMKCFATSTQVIASSRTVSPPAIFTTFPGVNFQIPIKTSVPITSSCINFTFGGTEDISLENKMKILNYCQRFMTININSSLNNSNPACIVCTDSTAKLFPQGMSLSNNTTCVVNATANRSSGLRILSSEINLKKDYRFLQANSSNSSNSSNITNNTNTTNSTNISTNSQTGLYTFSVCPVQDLVCGSDNLGPKPYYQYITEFSNSLKDSASFLSVLNIQNINLTSVSTSSDLTASSLYFTVGAFYLNRTDIITWNLTWYIPPQTKCWWNLGNSKKPTKDEILYCIESKFSCGVVSSGPSSSLVTVAIQNTNNNRMAYNANYFIWAMCGSNSVPNAKVTEVEQVYSFNTGRNPNIDTNNSFINLNELPTYTKPNSTKKNSSTDKLIGLGFAFALMVFFFIF